jgi:histidinol-phosphatase
LAVPPDLELALAAASRADDLTFSAFRRPGLVIETKPDSSPVTEVDRSVEAAVRELIAAERPGDAFIGEETGSTGDGRRKWVLDPIDGTVNFIRGIPVWATLLALQVDGEVVLGVVSSPVLGRRWWAERGQGAFARSADGNPERLSTSAVAALPEAAVSSGCIGDFPQPDRWVEIARRAGRDRGFGDFWQHVLVAEGALEAALEPVCSLWDIAALQVIVEESGGKFTAFSGERRLDAGNALSSNGLFHEELVGLLSGSAGG